MLLSNIQRKDYGAKNPKIVVGDHTYGNPKIYWWGEDAGFTIGKFCSIADNVKIYLGGNHRHRNITTYPLGLFFDDKSIATTDTKGDVTIGSDVVLHNEVTILSGVSIGDGAVIGAGAVVSKDIPSYAVAVGNPARVAKLRFTDEQIIALQKIRWWNWPVEKIRENAKLLMSENINEFIDKHNV